MSYIAKKYLCSKLKFDIACLWYFIILVDILWLYIVLEERVLIMCLACLHIVSAMLVCRNFGAYEDVYLSLSCMLCYIWNVSKIKTSQHFWYLFTFLQKMLQLDLFYLDIFGHGITQKTFNFKEEYYLNELKKFFRT